MSTKGTYTAEEARAKIAGWLSGQGWRPLSFQSQVWDQQARGNSGLLGMPTGAGKTYAAYLGLLPLLGDGKPGFRVLYVTPLRALSRDIERALRRPLEDIGLPLTVESRTGDTSSSARARQRLRKPSVLVTTPESLSLLLSYPSAAEDFKNLTAIIVDEWHELIGNKRGSLLELSLARLRRLSPRMMTWALSATLPNREEAAQTAVGTGNDYSLITGRRTREVRIRSLLPPPEGRLPWAGHLGIHMLPSLLAALDPTQSTLIFTNTRYQAERWYGALRDANPEWEKILALHHGSLDRGEREFVELGVKTGHLKIVVCTSSLDLGVDLPPVERVVQIGSPKAIGRLIQRAGRASHLPGAPCDVLFVPTHALELLEISACREAIEKGEIEPRRPIEKPLDVLVQFAVTRAMGGGFTPEELLEEARTAYSFRNLSTEELNWALNLVEHGGRTLSAYPQYKKVVRVDGLYGVTDAKIAQRHRLNVGTIVSDANLRVKVQGGKDLGSVEESFLAKLRPGDRFVFAGRHLELIRIRDLTAFVKAAPAGRAVIPQWAGGKLPISPKLSEAMRRRLDRLSSGREDDFETQALEKVLHTQRTLSAIPRFHEVLFERTVSREGSHLFLFPFEGRSVHEGLAALLAYRLARRQPATFSITVNDYGCEILADKDYRFELTRELFDSNGLLEDIRAALNMSELARRQFREIARIGGLVFALAPGREKTQRQLQASSSLLYDVFQRYDPDNLFLEQARREVRTVTFEETRLREVLTRIESASWAIQEPPFPSPLAFPLMVERMAARLTSETLESRVERLRAGWEKAWKSKYEEKPSASSRRKRSTGRVAKRSSSLTSIGESPKSSSKKESPSPSAS